MKYKIYTIRNLKEIKQLHRLSSTNFHDIQVVGNVLPFKANNYVVDELIDWDNLSSDSIYQLTFPQRKMLSKQHFSEMEQALSLNYTKPEIKLIANNIRYQLNPHPSGQNKNVPEIDGIKLNGVQHKYRETVLFFPSNSQTCHAYCTFCFRWPQFVGINELKFATRETNLLIKYLQSHPEVTDVLFTGGDPLVMKTKVLASYIDPLINNEDINLNTIRIGSKALGYWPYRFLTDNDADDLLRLFERVVSKGIHLAFMAHFNHPNELRTKAVEKAIKRILNTGVKIRTQSPIMNYINNDWQVWRDMWKKQVNLGCTPYYMFVARDTGAQEYFAVTLEEAWKVYRKAYQHVSGIARTVRGPSMSADPGKVQILGINEDNGKKKFVLRFIQGRNPNWVGTPFFAEYNKDAIWLNDLKPLYGDRFFYEKNLVHDALVNVNI